jgi:hypothetical protein
MFRRSSGEIHTNISPFQQVKEKTNSLKKTESLAGEKARKIFRSLFQTD